MNNKFVVRLSRWHSGKESACNAGDAGGVSSIHAGKIPWRRKWQPTPVFLPAKFHGQRSLKAHSAGSLKESDMTKQALRNKFVAVIC